MNQSDKTPQHSMLKHMRDKETLLKMGEEELLQEVARLQAKSMRLHCKLALLEGLFDLWLIVVLAMALLAVVIVWQAQAPLATLIVSLVSLLIISYCFIYKFSGFGSANWRQAFEYRQQLRETGFRLIAKLEAAQADKSD